MGLDTSHDCWSGPYSAFNRFRKNLCKEIGINIEDLYGYGGNKMHESDIKHDIMPLINHSDCDGILTVDDSKRIVKGLKSILKYTISKDDYYKEKIKTFIKGCELAISKNETIEFH